MQRSEKLAKCRILRREEFRPVFSGAQYKQSQKGIRILARPNQLGYARIGVVVPKKYIPTATGRNRIQRQVREFFRTRNQGPQGDIVILVYQALPHTLSNAQLRATLQQLWAKYEKQ